jgi:hypothetical protein
MTRFRHFLAIVLTAAVLPVAGCVRPKAPAPSLESSNPQERQKAVEALGDKHGG